MVDIASKRRDNVALFKKIFLFVKLAFMTVLSVIGSLYFVWTQYYNSEAERQIKRGLTPNWELCMKYCEENKILIISSVVCCAIACAFIAFLALHGVQTLVVRFMMRKANTGGR